MATKKLEWEEKYSVGVVEIDNQHKRMFEIINELFEAINNKIIEEKLDKIIAKVVDYKDFHFTTEEKYFKEFNQRGRVLVGFRLTACPRLGHSLQQLQSFENCLMLRGELVCRFHY